MQVKNEEGFQESVLEICRQDLETAAPVLQRIEIAKSNAVARNDPSPVDEWHGSMLPFLGAAYYLRDATRFSDGVQAIQHMSNWYVEQFSPAPWQLLVDLCLAVINGPDDLCRLFCRAVLQRPDTVGNEDAYGLSARIIAAAVELDRAVLFTDTQRLITACGKGVFPRRHAQVFRAFSFIARRIGQDAMERAKHAIALADRMQYRLVALEIGRFNDAEPTPITAAAFIDLPTAALVAVVAHRLPRAVRDAMVPTRFSDAEWMTKAVHQWV